MSIGIALSLLFLETQNFYKVLDLKLYDLQMVTRQTPAQDDRILFVEMDNEAIDNLGRWPWPRNIFANLTNTLNDLGAKQIIFDVTFSQPTQVIVDKEAIDHVFKGRDQIKKYITDEIGIVKSKELIPQKDVVWSLEQIRKGFSEYTSATEQKLNNAIVDNDEIFADALKDKNTFVGYSFEVLFNADDLRRLNLFKEIKRKMFNWLNDHPKESFSALPPSLKENDDFENEEIQAAFNKIKILKYLENNIAISLNEASVNLDGNPKQLREIFVSTKKQFILDKVILFLKDNPHAELKDVIYKYEVFDMTTQNLFKEVWLTALNEFIATNKFGISSLREQKYMATLKVQPPYHLFTDAAKGGGFLNGLADHDGVLRNVNLFVKHKDELFVHIALASVLDLYKPKNIAFSSSGHFIMHDANVGGKLRDVKIPLDESGALIINWAGKWHDTFKHMSIAEIYHLYYLKEENLESQQALIDERLKKLGKRVKDKICIIGLTATGTHDYNPIPYEPSYPMVGTHGNVLNTLLTEQFITKVPHAINVLLIFVLVVLMGLVLPFLSSIKGLIYTCFILAATVISSVFLFSKGLSMNLSSPVLLSLFSYISITSYQFATEEKSKREIKNAFSKYVPPDVIEEIIRDPTKLQLGGTKKELAVLFSDIRGFTAYSEKRTPEEVVNILNEYLDSMTKVIVQYKGTLDKYIGDAIMAIWGAPQEATAETSSRRAVISAIKMIEKLDELHKKWSHMGLEPLDIGIGINTGNMVVGNIGSELRMDYTVSGDAVNVGSRVEAFTRQFNERIIITGDTYKYVQDIVHARPLEKVKVKGKEISVMIYAVDGLKSVVNDLSLYM